MSEPIRRPDLDHIRIKVDVGAVDIREIGMAVLQAGRETVGQKEIGANAIGQAGFLGILVRKTRGTQGHIGLELAHVVAGTGAQAPQVRAAVEIVMLDIVVVQFAAQDELAEIVQITSMQAKRVEIARIDRNAGDRGVEAALPVLNTGIEPGPIDIGTGLSDGDRLLNDRSDISPGKGGARNKAGQGGIECSFKLHISVSHANARRRRILAKPCPEKRQGSGEARCDIFMTRAFACHACAGVFKPRPTFPRP